MRDFIIIPAHNRSAYTLGCLSQLRKVNVLERFSVIVVDDGSTDGTAELIKNEYPEVIVLFGPGDLYWTGAIELGMRYAIEHGAESMVWLNDDAQIMAGAVERLVTVAKECEGIASALCFVDMHTQGKNWYFPATYKTKTGLSSVEIRPNTGLISVDACRGNLVAITRSVVKKIDFPDGKGIPHVAGDTDYTLRATRQGIPCLVVSDILLEEKDTVRSNNQSWLLGGEKLNLLWKKIFKKRGSFYPPMRWIYLTRHWGWRGAIQYPLPYLKLAAISLIRCLIPRSLLLKMYGDHSHAWKATAWSRAEEQKSIH